MSFVSLGLSAPLLEAVAEQGYNTPTSIQAHAIPAVIKGRDVMGAAQTGTGKTAGFTLPPNAVKFKQLEVLVLDEADRMLDMGFIQDIRNILGALPKQRQNLMFSATFSDEIRQLAKGLVKQPVEISVNPRNTTAKTVKQWICPVDKKQKPACFQSSIYAPSMATSIQIPI